MPVTTGHGGIEAALLEIQIETLAKIAALFEINEHDHGEPKTFRELVSSAVDLCHLDRDAVAAHFKISQGTLSRWIQGRNAPHRLARSVVTADLHKMLEERKDQQEKRLAELKSGDPILPIPKVPAKQARKPVARAKQARKPVPAE